MATILYNNSCYNLLEAYTTTKDLVDTAITLNYHAIALCDEGTMFGAMEFYHYARQKGIKPIIGLSIFVEYKDAKLHFCLYAKNSIGYYHLIRMSSQTQLGELIKFTDLFTIEDSLIFCLLFDGPYFDEDFVELSHETLANKIKKITQSLPTYLGIVNADNQYHQRKNDLIRTIAKENHLLCIAMPLSLYPLKEDVEKLKVLKAIKLQTLISDNNLTVESERHLWSLKDLQRYYSPQEILICQDIADQCAEIIDFKLASLPIFQNTANSSSKDFLTKLCFKGLAKRLKNQVTKEYQQRLSDELAVILKMGYEDYFLLVYDFVLYAKRLSIYTGPGRGSAAGSLVSYCLGITHLDPIKYKLFFERFLNPERVSMPDIDTDIADTGRDDVIKYLFDKYTNNQIAHIITFGTFKAKQAIRDVAKVYGVSLNKIDILAKTIPNEIDLNLGNILSKSEKFRHIIEEDKDYQKIYEMAKAIEFLPRHTSIHAAGIVLADKSISNYIPITRINDLITTQYTMNYLEEFGLIKMDILGLRNLTIIDDICKKVEINNIYAIPLDDQRVYEILSKAKTLGVFQLESTGMRNLLSKLQPTSFEDIIAILALYRPGPMQNIEQYLYNRHHSQDIKYAHPTLKVVLENTYGVMVYQEQIMQIVQMIAGFSLGKADILRKAISKKNETELKALKNDFVDGCQLKGLSRQAAENVFALIEKFANYGFNRSHSAAYALIAYQCAYLKVHFPLQFYQSLLNSVIGNESRTKEYILEAKNSGVKILPPSINFSGIDFLIENNGLRFPLTIIKGLGFAFNKRFLDIRNEIGAYENIYQFVALNMMEKSSINIGENLIKVGALDEFHLSRQTMLANIEVIFDYCKLIHSDKIGQGSLLLDSVAKPILIEYKDNIMTNLHNEQILTGMYFSKHPTELIMHQISEKTSYIQDVDNIPQACVIGLLIKVKIHRTKTAQLMAFIGFEDVSGSMEAVIMPTLFNQVSQELEEGNIFLWYLVRDRKGGYLVKSMVKYSI